MNDGEIKERLRDRNPWWRDPAWSQRDVVLRDAASAPFDYTPSTLDGIEPPNLYVVTGPRRVGKSVAMRRKIKALLEAEAVAPRSVIACSCEGLRPQDLRRLFKAGRAITPGGDDAVRWWFLDEITAVGDEWSSVVKELRDNTGLRHDCVVLTGSSSRGLREAVDNLAGRRGPGAARSDRLLLPVGFRRFCALANLDRPRDIPALTLDQLFTRAAREALQELSFWTEPLIDAWENYLHVGGYPRAIADFTHHGDVGDGFVRDLWDVVRGDAIRGAGLADATILAFLERLGAGVANPLNASDVARDAGLADNHAVNARIDDLVVNFLAWRCPRSIDGTPSATAQRKVYFTDPLLARLATSVSRQRSAPDPSKLSEQQLGLALARAIDDRDPGTFVLESRLMYQRTATKKEIDFVGPDLDGCVEAKYVDTSWKREAQTARANYRHALLGTRRIHDLDDDQVWAAPAPAIAWLLDGG